MQSPAPPQKSESVVTLNQPGRLIGVLESCMAARLRPHRSGWSAAYHLSRDLERHFGVRAPAPAILRALQVLARRRQIQLKVDAEGVLWYRLTT